MDISAIKLVRLGTDAVVLMEVMKPRPCIVLNSEGQLDPKASQAARCRWVEIIREPFDGAFCHIVEEDKLCDLANRGG